MPARKATEAVLSSCFPSGCDERRREIVPGRGLRSAPPAPPAPLAPSAPWAHPRGANASHRTVTSPCRHRTGPSVTGQSAVRSRTARIQRCRAP